MDSIQFKNSNLKFEVIKSIGSDRIDMIQKYISENLIDICIVAIKHGK